MLFRMNKDGTHYTALYSFRNNGSDGTNPEGALTQGSDGFLYGTTGRGGYPDDGTVFKIAQTG